MFKDMTFETLLGRMLANVPGELDKREGGVVYDMLAPAAMELARFYAALDDVVDECFADTAGREMLARRAAERGITPFPATPAAVKAEFNTAVPLGSRFSCEDVRYAVTEKLAEQGWIYRAVCETPGTLGNRTAGELLPVDYVDGLTTARITALLLPGTDDENAESLRKRYFAGFEAQSFGGNISDYREKVMAIPGVGGVKVEPNGGGSVRLVVCDSSFGVPDGELVARVAELIDPPEHSGLGVGLAPVGHRVIVAAATAGMIDVFAEFSLARGWSFADALPSIRQAAGDYILELARGWADSGDGGVIVRAAVLETKLLDLPAVADIRGLRLNSLSAADGGNVTLAPDEVPVLGDVANTA